MGKKPFFGTISFGTLVLNVPLDLKSVQRFGHFDTHSNLCQENKIRFYKRLLEFLTRKYKIRNTLAENTYKKIYRIFILGSHSLPKKVLYKLSAVCKKNHLTLLYTLFLQSLFIYPICVAYILYISYSCSLCLLPSTYYILLLAVSINSLLHVSSSCSLCLLPSISFLPTASIYAFHIPLLFFFYFSLSSILLYSLPSS